MVITKETPIVLYGAGEVGEIIGKNIINNGYFLSCYLDKRKYGAILNGVEIYSPDYELQYKTSALVIVCLSDATLHKSVSEMLYDRGYQFILFIPFGYRISDEKSKFINKLFDAFQYDFIKEQKMELDSYEELIDNFCGYNAYINSVENGWMNIYVDAEQLYTESMELWEGDKSKTHGKDMYYDINIWFYKPYIVLMETLLGKSDSLEDYWKAFETLTFDKEQRIKNRERLVQEFEYHKDKNDNFFVESASKAVLNPRGYWNLHGGHHRTCYLIAKGEVFLPIKVRVSDYERWANAHKVEVLGDRIKNLSQGKLKTKINHPALIDYEGERENSANRMFRDIFNCINVCDGTKQKYLDLSDMDGFFSRNVIRQRLGKAYLHYSKRSELVQLLDEVLAIKGVEYLSDKDSDCMEYDTVFCINRYNEFHEQNEELIKKVLNYSRNRAFVELNIEDVEKVTSIMKFNGFANAQRIHKEYLNGSMRETYLYEK